MSMVVSVEEVRGIVRIGLDDAESLSVNKRHFAKLPVKTGEEIDVEEYIDRMAAVQMSDAYEAALTLLDHSAQSSREIVRKLRLKGYVAPAAEAVSARLAENRLIDDRAYAKRLTEVQSMRGTGLYAVRRKLTAKGFSEEDIEQAMEVIDDDQQLAAAKTLAVRLYRKYASLPGREARGKLSQALARRGFSWDVVSSAVESVINGED